MLRKTHSINELVLLCSRLDLDVGIAEEDGDLLDTIYLPTKYPLGGVLPEFEPDIPLCKRCLDIVEFGAFGSQDSTIYPSPWGEGARRADEGDPFNPICEIRVICG